MRSQARWLATLITAVILTACGGGGGDSVEASSSNLKRLGAAPAAADEDDVILPNDRSQYQIASTEAGYVITNIPADGNSQRFSVLRRVQFADISVALDVDHSSQIYRLYQAAFNRKPDLAGLGHWLNILDGGTSLESIAQSFVGSEEFQKLYGIDPDNTLFLTRLYKNALHREPDAAGLASWVKTMQLGVTRAQVLVGFSESAENKAAVATAVENGIAYVQPGVNYRPVAVAGDNLQAITKSTVTLDASASTDANNDKLKFAWSIIAKPGTSLSTLQSSAASKPYFVPDVAGNYTLSLVVSDSSLASRTTTISVTVSSAAITPIPDTGIYKCSQLTPYLAQALFLSGHTYLDRDRDGKPCEANDIKIETPVTPVPTVKRCWVNAYTRKNGTYVRGYWRSC